MLQTDDLPRMTPLSPGNNAIVLKLAEFISKVNTKCMKICDVHICVICDCIYIHFCIYIYILIHACECFHTCPRTCLITHELVLTV